MALADRLKERRTALGMTQEQVALAVGTNETRYRDWEKDSHVPSAGAIIRLAKALNVSADWLLEITSEIQPVVQKQYGVNYEKHIFKGADGQLLCDVEHCAWRVNCGDGKFYCPGAGCMKERAKQ